MLNIRAMRKRNGMTQVALANKLGLKSSATVTMWESGTRHPSSTLLPRLAEALGCSIGDLFEFEEKEK